MPTISAPSLSDLQTWMRWVLTHPHGVGCALNNHSHALDRCTKVIGETPQVDRETRLSIYGNGYFQRIIEVLESNYSSIRNVVGENDFYDLARAYLVKYPSIFKSIDDVGAPMSPFLKKHPLSKKFPFLPELAHLEWTAHQAFFADDVAPLALATFENIPPSKWLRATFTLDPAVTLLKLFWPVDLLWRDDGKWDQRRIKSMKRGPLRVLVYRPADKWVRVPRITPIQFELLSHLSNQKTLGKALSSLVKKHPLLDTSLVRNWFSRWITDGVIRQVHFPLPR